MAESLLPSHDPSTGPITTEQSQYYDKGGRHLGPRGPGGAFRGSRNPGTTLLWYGEAVNERMAALALEAVQRVAEEAADHARANHEWISRSGETEDSIFVGTAEITSHDVARCLWGAGGAAIYLEYGTVKMPAFPFLRPAQEATYPHLVAAMRV